MQLVPPPSTNGHESHASHASQALQASQVHPEIRSLVQLNTAHAYKVYYSGPLVRKIERLPDGQTSTKDDGWTDIWAQLCGTTLNIWVMKQVQEASKQGREVPPTYFNVTDAFVHVIGAITVPETSTSPAKRYTDILAMNTAGTNLILFSCPSREALMAWVAALRLSSWEKSRLEEIYTAHLIRTTQQARDIPSTLVRGRMEGWAQIRIACQTDWKRLWLVIQAGPDGDRPSSSGGYDGNEPPRKRRISSFFSRDHSPAQSSAQQPILLFYSSPKPKDRKRPLLTLQNVTQAFAVYPDRPELISKSTLIKVEGQFADDELVRDMKNREGWILVMPDTDKIQNQAGELLKWIIALHDAFRLYGRPHAWSWDPREPSSMMFGYPVGPQKESLFLDREVAEALDPRDDRTSFIRANFQSLLSNKLQNAGIRVISPEPPQQPPLQPQFQQQQQQQPPEQNHAGLGFSPLPPLSFGDIGLQHKTPLAPVAESSRGNTPIEAKSDPPFNTTSSPLNTTSPPLNTASPSLNTTSPPLNTTPTQPVAAALPSPYLSTTNNQGPQKSPSITSPAPSSASSLNPSSPSKTTVMMRSREDSITRSSFSSNRDRSQPMAFSASQSTTDDRPPSRTSILTSPHSITDRTSASDKRRSMETALPLASPYSPVLSRRDLPPIGPPPSKALPTAPSDDLSNEAGALYYMSNIEAEPDRNTKKSATRVPTTIAEQDDTASSWSDHERPISPSVTVPSSIEPVSPRPVFVERPASSDPAARQSPTARSGLRRKPSGAREQGTGRSLKSGVSSSTKSLTEDTDSDESMDRSQVSPPQVKIVQPLPSEDANLDVLAALSYLDVNDEPPPTSKTVRNQKMSPPSSPAPSPSVPFTTPTAATIDDKAASQFRSSFALSKQAVERKAKAQAQQIAHHAAVHKPGRLNGKQKSRVGGGWNESSDEEEEEEEDDDDDDEANSDSDDAPASNKLKPPSSGHASSNTSLKPPQNSTHMSHRNEIMTDYQGVQPRGPRNLPQVPNNRPYGEDHPPPRRMVSDQFSDVGRRPNHDENHQIRSQSELPHPGSAQKSLWSQVLDPGRPAGHFPEQNTRDTFIQLEHPSETMTKAFTPQGLLSAGLQDKQDRSAKRQEELARETGASLINVPNKPPPPQTGLLGAITAHERERKREGGMGAALTEREREKRAAEERQRRFDEQQRQQLEQMQQGGSMYGQFPGFNPMMNPMMGMGMMGMNPMMTGMNPMMTGGMAPMMTGYNPMMPALNAQQMFAAQKAATQAYQQAMMAYSTAGSQMGGGDNGGTQPMVPNMTGSMPFMGYDPRMSMMGMGMMGPQMGMPLGMQMTGMSTFDPRFSNNPGNGGAMNDLGLQPPNVLGAQNPGSRSSSPARRDSPAVRPAPDQHGEVPRGSSPKS